MPVLRETGASLDIGFKKCAAPEMFKGEQGLTRRQRRKETGKSTRLENDDDEFRLGECVVEIGEDFVPSLTGEGIGFNLALMEAHLRSEESAPLIRGTEKGASEEAGDQEEEHPYDEFLLDMSYILRQ
ncbi:uncharacterized protein TNCV_3105841 [Trichonephila clavipes]|nr:uncharacterized protein TNCV_3105841 [Trichonephila clavipes]